MRIRHATVVGLTLVPTALVFTSACVVRTYEAPYYQQQPQRTAYVGTARPSAQGAYGGARYGQPAPQPYAGTMGGARYAAPAQPQYTPPPQYAPGAMGGARYAAPAQPGYTPGPQYVAQPTYPAGAIGGARYGTPAQPTYVQAPVGATIYPAPPPPRPVAVVTFGAPVAGPVQVGLPGAIWVPADRPEPVWLAQALMPGQWYVVEAWGAFSCWFDHGDGVDPYYGYGPWYFGAQPQPWAQLLVDERPMYEIARASGHYTQYRPDHHYSTMMVGNGTRPKLQIASARNGSWRTNHGGLWVRIYPAQRPHY
jgi:hypothetical protein